MAPLNDRARPAVSTKRPSQIRYLLRGYRSVALCFASGCSVVAVSQNVIVAFPLRLKKFVPSLLAWTATFAVHAVAGQEPSARRSIPAKARELARAVAMLHNARRVIYACARSMFNYHQRQFNESRHSQTRPPNSVNEHLVQLARGHAPNSAASGLSSLRIR
jgi:hypothetical protein